MDQKHYEKTQRSILTLGTTLAGIKNHNYSKEFKTDLKSYIVNMFKAILDDIDSDEDYDSPPISSEVAFLTKLIEADVKGTTFRKPNEFIMHQVEKRYIEISNIGKQ